ncbi:MAG: nucleotidyltransferase domain-containing protein [Acetivibrio sp.]
MKIDESISFLDEAKRAFLQEGIKYLMETLQRPEYIILFGSYARGEEKAGSDMDLLVITKREVDRILKGKLCSRFEEKNMDLVFYTRDTFQTSQCLLVQQVKQEGIVLWKKN